MPDTQIFSLWVLSALLLALILARLIVWLVRERLDAPEYRELLSRIRTWWIIIILFYVTLFAPTIVFFSLVALLLLVELSEWETLINQKKSAATYIFISGGTILLLAGFLIEPPYLSPVSYCLVLLVISSAAIAFLRNRNRSLGPLKDSLILCGILCALTGLFVMSVTLGKEWVLYVVILTQFNDVAQYAWGRILGRTRICERISPNKTWEGFFGGLVTTILVAATFLRYLLNLTPLEAAIAALFICTLGLLGDLSISTLKRRAHVRHTGTLLPGHGGILDRVDSLIWNIPVILILSTIATDVFAKEIGHILKQGGILATSIT